MSDPAATTNDPTAAEGVVGGEVTEGTHVPAETPETPTEALAAAQDALDEIPADAAVEAATAPAKEPAVVAAAEDEAVPVPDEAPSTAEVSAPEDAAPTTPDAALPEDTTPEPPLADAESAPTPTPAAEPAQPENPPATQDAAPTPDIADTPDAVDTVAPSTVQEPAVVAAAEDEAVPVPDEAPSTAEVSAPEDPAPATPDAALPEDTTPEPPLADAESAPTPTPAAEPAQPENPPATQDAAPTEAPATDVAPGPADAQPAGSLEPQAPDAAKPAGAKPSHLPKPSRPPKPSSLRRQAAPTVPVAEPAVPVPPALDAAAVSAAEAFGRVDDEGNVYVHDASGERTVGQVPGSTPSEAMSLYVRRYLDLSAKVSLFETRLSSADLSVKEIDQTLNRLKEETAEPAAIGDLDGLRTRIAALGTVAAERRAALDAARAAAKAEAVAARTAIVEAAEKVSATDPQRMQWRPAGEELRTLLDSWKEAQRSGPRIDRTTEEALWKRFSHARTAFDRERRHYFAELEQRNSTAKAAKERLVAEAEALSSSTDWGATAGVFRDLMARWKAAGRAARRDDDALWARFRAAQDAFFAARDAQNAAIDAEYAANLTVKEALLVEAEALVPVKDLAAAKGALRGIQERWEVAGKVPRGDIQRVEGRLRAVEQTIRDAEQAQWARSNPETRARAEGAAAQLEAAIDSLEADLARARAKGDKRKTEELETALAARRAWLEQVVRAAEDSRG